MKIFRNQYGLTLIEVLVTLVIFSIFSTVIIQIVLNTTNNFQRENLKIMMRQDADYVIETIANSYYAEGKMPENLIVEDKKVKLQENQFISNPKFDYSGSTFTSQDKTLTIQLTIKPIDNHIKVSELTFTTTLYNKWGKGDKD
jgi:prepilin-type N-terminal cleavage/methylation domain-containing protein